MKEYLRKHKELIRWTSMIPLAAIIPIFPINLFLLIVQISCLSLMFWIGWNFE